MGGGSVGFCPPPPLQSTLNVDGAIGSDVTKNPYATITAAANDAQSGATILVKGMTVGGKPFGYTQTGNPDNPNSSGETFPIPVSPGVTVKGDNTGPTVYVYNSVSSNPPNSLFDLDASSAQGPSTIALRNLHILGSGMVVPVGQSPTFDTGAVRVFFSNQGLTVTLKNLVFSGNTIAATLTGIGATLNANITKCTISDETIAVDLSAAGPVTNIPVYGFFAAVQTADAQINATFSSLKTAGLFQGGDQAGQFDSLIELYAKGLTQEMGGANPIDTVHVEFLGGTLDGKASAGIPPLVPPGGWKTGIHAIVEGEVETADDNNHDYKAALDVVLSGTLVTDFRDTGIFGESRLASRGRLELNGGTVIQRTGSQNGTNAPPAGQEFGTGVFLKANQGYFGMISNGSSQSHAVIKDNWRDGAHLIARETDRSEHGPSLLLESPMGMMADLGWLEVSGNREDGIHMVGDEGIVGSTWFFDSQNQRHILSAAPTSQKVTTGIGEMNGCMVHNNTGKGLRFELTLPVDNPPFSMGILRVFNSFFWNNGEEAIFADGPGFNASSQQTILAVPVIHCTIAGNGDSVGQDVEIPGGTGTLDNFQWIENDLNSPGNLLFAQTKFFDTILERKSSNARDFGNGIQTRLKAETTSADLPGNYAFGKIYVAGLRESDPTVPTGPEGTNIATPFAVSPPVWTSGDVTQFFLDVTANSFGLNFDNTPTHLGALSAMDKADFDILGKARPAITTGTRDKGGRENN